MVALGTRTIVLTKHHETRIASGVRVAKKGRIQQLWEHIKGGNIT